MAVSELAAKAGLSFETICRYFEKAAAQAESIDDDRIKVYGGDLILSFFL